MPDRKIKAWWFSKGLKLPNGDGRHILLGRTHKVEGKIVPCHNGLHASIRPLDALNYVPGPIVWRVEMSGTVVREGDKLAASTRTYIAGGIDVSDTLRRCARLCALDVIDLWDAPEIVVSYLKTGDESIRYAVGDAAQAAYARTAARAVAWDAARAAAREAAWDGVRAAQNDRLTEMLMALEPKN